MDFKPPEQQPYNVNPFREYKNGESQIRPIVVNNYFNGGINISGEPKPLEITEQTKEAILQAMVQSLQEADKSSKPFYI